MKSIYNIFFIISCISLVYAGIEDDIIVSEDSNVVLTDVTSDGEYVDYTGSDFQQREPIMGTSPDSVLHYAFPKFTDGKFESGEVVDLMLGFGNNGDQTFHVQSLSASLVSVDNFGNFLENYTRIDYSGYPVAPGEEGSFLYRFLPDPVLEPNTFGLSARVYYGDEEGTTYIAHFFNSTVEIVEAEGALDAVTFFTYLAGAAVAALVAYTYFMGDTQVSSSSSKSSSGALSPTSPTSPASPTSDDDDWLEDTTSPKSPKKGRRKK